ncbi:PAS domain-containing protein [Psychromonas sp. KJ10-10]|uniref:PAS domain-containing protein n=1 Tax=Psychromonas sp. KJ10-10 TaxID=3391823 RepID=UPI0039B44AAE
MKNNQPVNNNQKTFKEGSNLVSTTDLNGVIEYVNKDFIEISGFSSEELIGQNHHIVRHPDMPEVAFLDLWSTVKSGKEWRGIVKNRCKDGGYYWVDAFVMPIIKDGVKVGYQSIRSKPSAKQIKKQSCFIVKCDEIRV